MKNWRDTASKPQQRCLYMVLFQVDILEPETRMPETVVGNRSPAPQFQDPGISDVCLGNPMGIGICGQTESHVPLTLTETDPPGMSQVWKHLRDYRHRIVVVAPVFCW